MDNGAGPAGRRARSARRGSMGFSAWPPREVRADDATSSATSGALRRAPAGERRRDLRRRPEGAPAADAAGQRRGRRLEGAAAVQLGAAGRRQGRRVRDRAAGRRRRDRRRRRASTCLLRSSAPRHRPPGHAQRGPPRRQRDLRAERLAARVAPQARSARARPRSTRCRRTSRATRRRCRAGASRTCGCRSSRSPTRSAPGRGSA